MNQLKVFTLEEVNLILPQVRSLITQLHGLRHTIIAKEAEVDLLEMVAEKKSESPQVLEAVNSYQSLVNRFYDEINRMTESGYHLKDLEEGLVDFYTIYDNRLVFLCWKWDEEKASDWHEIDSGFAARQPIAEKPRKDGNQR